MSNLSWVVVHGALLWQVALAVSFLGGVFFARFRPDLALRGRAARVREAFGTATPTVDARARGTDVVLSGTLAAPREDASGVAVVTVSPRGVELSEEPSAKAVSATREQAPLVIDVDGTRVVLDAVQIVVGSLETGRCVPPAKAKEFLWDFAAQLGVLSDKPFGVRSLSYGDRVRVAGRLRHEPDAAAPGGYRSAGAAYFLDVPETAATKVLPLAFEGKPRALARGKGTAMLSALAVPLGVVALLGAIGEVTIRIHRPFSLSLASTTPFRRADALGELRTELHLNDHADSALVNRAVHLDLLRGRCGDASEDYFDHGEPIKAAELAERCNDNVHAARAWFAAAEFERAAHAYHAARTSDPRLPPTLSEATAYIAARMNDRAATMVRGLIPIWEGPQGSRERLGCVADALEARNGSMETLRTHAKRGVHAEACAILLADLLSGKEREEVLAPIVTYRPWSSPDRLAELLAVEGHAESAKTQRLGLAPPDIFIDPRDAITIPPALVETALAALGDDRSIHAEEVRTELVQRRAAFESFLGDDAAALVGMEAIRADLEKRSHRTYTAEQRRVWYERQYDPNYFGDGQPFGMEQAQLMKGFDPEKDRGEAQAESLLDGAIYISALFATHRGDSPAAMALLQKEKSHWYFGRHLTEQILRLHEAHDGTTIEELGASDTRESNRKLWELAALGDGAGLAARMRAHGLDGRGVVDRVAFHLPGGKDELKNWVRWSYPPPCSTCGLYPLANTVASRHDAAVAIGDEELARDTREIALRLRALFLRRDTAVVLAELSTLSPP